MSKQHQYMYGTEPGPLPITPCISIRMSPEFRVYMFLWTFLNMTPVILKEISLLTKKPTDHQFRINFQPQFLPSNRTKIFGFLQEQYYNYFE